MKCKTCKKRMSDVLIDLDCKHNDMTKKAVNIPACQCPSCNKVIIPDMILGKLESFAECEKGNIIDYAKCEENEAAIITATHTFFR